LLLLGSLNLLEMQAWARLRPRLRGILPPYPAEGTETQLVLGEAHEQDGRRSDAPWWFTLPEGGMYMGVVVVGATGAGKTHSALGPYLRQLIRLHRKDPARCLGGLVIDAKGNMAADVERLCVEAGRGEDFYRISMPSARMNILNRPDLSAAALAGHIGTVLENVEGASSADPFWDSAARELATQALRLIRLSRRRAPTMADLYRVSASNKAFKQELASCRAALQEVTDAELAELESLEYWQEYSLKPRDGKTQASIVATLSRFTSLFDELGVRQCFCATGADETFPGFDTLIEAGKIVVLSLPQTLLKHVSVIVATMTKLNFQDAVLRRLALAETTNAELGRGVFFVADEYDQYVSRSDPTFLSKCREARACNVIAVQSHAMLEKRLPGRGEVDALLANLRTKIYLAVADNGTAEAAAKLAGRREQPKQVRAVTESSKHASFSLVDRGVLAEGDASSSATITTTKEDKFVFPPWVFTSLRRFQAVVMAFDGKTALPPWVVYLKPLHLDPNLSYFDTEEAA
jgi:hypothetical protein